VKDSDSIFLIDGQGQLERVPHHQYETEELLQSLVDKHPELLVGEQIDPDRPPRWLVVRREAGIPSAEDAADRWSVDHLLLDQHGRPTFVEVKRSSDTRIRREVVGQMLDYAANAQVYWPRDKIKALAADSVGSVEELDTRLLEFLDPDGTSEGQPLLDDYWDAVERNLRNGEIRLLFVADEIPTELRRIIEFLNDHMALVEVLGVEIRQYAGREIRALVPRVVGRTEFARQQKASSGRVVRKTTEAEFLSACSEDARRFFVQLLSDASKRGCTVSWGQMGFSVRLPTPEGKLLSFFYGYLPGVNASPTPLFQAYLGYVEDPADHNTLRQAFGREISFTAKGKHTLELALDADTVAAASSKLSALLDIAEHFANSGTADGKAP